MDGFHDWVLWARTLPAATYFCSQNNKQKYCQGQNGPIRLLPFLLVAATLNIDKYDKARDSGDIPWKQNMHPDAILVFIYISKFEFEYRICN